MHQSRKPTRFPDFLARATTLTGDDFLVCRRRGNHHHFPSGRLAEYARPVCAGPNLPFPPLVTPRATVSIARMHESCHGTALGVVRLCAEGTARAIRSCLGGRLARTGPICSLVLLAIPRTDAVHNPPGHSASSTVRPLLQYAARRPCVPTPSFPAGIVDSGVQLTATLSCDKLWRRVLTTRYMCTSLNT